MEPPLGITSHYQTTFSFSMFSFSSLSYSLFLLLLFHNCILSNTSQLFSVTIIYSTTLFWLTSSKCTDKLNIYLPHLYEPLYLKDITLQFPNERITLSVFWLLNNTLPFFTSCVAKTVNLSLSSLLVLLTISLITATATYVPLFFLNPNSKSAKSLLLSDQLHLTTSNSTTQQGP